jgi:hypothetical protein
MITDIQAKQIADNFAETLKGKNSITPFAKILPMVSNQKEQYLDLNNVVEFWSGYHFAVKQVRDILPHTQRDLFPAHLFENMGPNAKERDKLFAKLNYKAITMPVFIDFLNTIMRAFQDGNWSIKYEDEEYQKYLQEELPLYDSLEVFMKEIFVATKLRDANGIIAIKPYEVSYMLDDEGKVRTDDLGNPLIADELIQPYPVYYQSKDIISQLQSVYYAVISGEKSLVELQGKQVSEGIVIEIYDDKHIWRINQVGKKDKYEFGQPQIYWQHDLGYIPAIKLKGVPVLMPDSIEKVGLMYASHFSYAVDNLDRVITDDATLEIVKKKCAFPYMVAVGQACDFSINNVKCNNGKIWDEDATKEIVCPSCNGSGLKNRLSPSGELLINPGTGLDTGDTQLKGDYIKFVAPDTQIFEFLEQQKKDNENRARRIIHIKDVDGKFVYNSDKTATGSDNDMKAMYAFIQPISDQIFDAYKFFVDTIEDMRYGKTDEHSVIIVAPQSFDLSSSSDYLEQITALSNAGAPPTTIREFMHKFLRSMFYADVESAQILEVIMAADNLMPFNNETIAAKVERGVAEKWQEILHDQAFNLVQEVISEVPNYLTLPMGEQIDLLKAKAQSKVPVQQGDDLATRLLSGLGG